MTDKEKFYKLALNIVNYPYEKAVYLDEGKIRLIKVFPNSRFFTNEIEFLNYENEWQINIIQDNYGEWVDLYDLKYVNHIIHKIKTFKDEKVKLALLEGIV